MGEEPRAKQIDYVLPSDTDESESSRSPVSCLPNVQNRMQFFNHFGEILDVCSATFSERIAQDWISALGCTPLLAQKSLKAAINRFSLGRLCPSHEAANLHRLVAIVFVVTKQAESEAHISLAEALIKKLFFKKFSDTIPLVADTIRARMTWAQYELKRQVEHRDFSRLSLLAALSFMVEKEPLRFVWMRYYQLIGDNGQATMNGNNSLLITASNEAQELRRFGLSTFFCVPQLRPSIFGPQAGEHYDNQISELTEDHITQDLFQGIQAMCTASAYTQHVPLVFRRQVLAHGMSFLHQVKVSSPDSSSHAFVRNNLIEMMKMVLVVPDLDTLLPDASVRFNFIAALMRHDHLVGAMTTMPQLHAVDVAMPSGTSAYWPVASSDYYQRLFERMLTKSKTLSPELMAISTSPAFRFEPMRSNGRMLNDVVRAIFQSADADSSDHAARFFLDIAMLLETHCRLANDTQMPSGVPYYALFRAICAQGLAYFFQSFGGQARMSLLALLVLHGSPWFEETIFLLQRLDPHLLTYCFTGFQYAVVDGRLLLEACGNAANIAMTDHFMGLFQTKHHALCQMTPADRAVHGVSQVPVVNVGPHENKDAPYSLFKHVIEMRDIKAFERLLKNLALYCEPSEIYEGIQSCMVVETGRESPSDLKGGARRPGRRRRRHSSGGSPTVIDNAASHGVMWYLFDLQKHTGLPYLTIAWPYLQVVPEFIDLANLTSCPPVDPHALIWESVNLLRVIQATPPEATDAKAIVSEIAQVPLTSVSGVQQSYSGINRLIKHVFLKEGVFNRDAVIKGFGMPDAQLLADQDLPEALRIFMYLMRQVDMCQMLARCEISSDVKQFLSQMLVLFALSGTSEDGFTRCYQAWRKGGYLMIVDQALFDFVKGQALVDRVKVCVSQLKGVILVVQSDAERYHNLSQVLQSLVFLQPSDKTAFQGEGFYKYLRLCDQGHYFVKANLFSSESTHAHIWVRLDKEDVRVWLGALVDFKEGVLRSTASLTGVALRRFLSKQILKKYPLLDKVCIEFIRPIVQAYDGLTKQFSGLDKGLDEAASEAKKLLAWQQVLRVDKKSLENCDRYHAESVHQCHIHCGEAETFIQSAIDDVQHFLETHRQGLATLRDEFDGIYKEINETSFVDGVYESKVEEWFSANKAKSSSYFTEKLDDMARELAAFRDLVGVKLAEAKKKTRKVWDLYLTATSQNRYNCPSLPALVFASQQEEEQQLLVDMPFVE